jgi:hypothetical protein
MITFEPDSPWEVGQLVKFREDGRPPYQKVVESLEWSRDGLETHHHRHLRGMRRPSHYRYPQMVR